MLTGVEFTKGPSNIVGDSEETPATFASIIDLEYLINWHDR